jgi:hypothetical protein
MENITNRKVEEPSGSSPASNADKPSTHRPFNTKSPPQSPKGPTQRPHLNDSADVSNISTYNGSLLADTISMITFASDESIQDDDDMMTTTSDSTELKPSVRLRLQHSRLLLAKNIRSSVSFTQSLMQRKRHADQNFYKNSSSFMEQSFDSHSTNQLTTTVSDPTGLTRASLVQAYDSRRVFVQQGTLWKDEASI